MSRTARIASGGVVFHVLNRTNARAGIFESDDDYQAFEQVIAETARQVPVRVLVVYDHA